MNSAYTERTPNQTCVVRGLPAVQTNAAVQTANKGQLLFSVLINMAATSRTQQAVQPAWRHK
jgi:hypothetical protein